MNRITILKLRSVALLCLLWAFVSVPLHAIDWFPLGPYGGDARSFAADPHDSKHLYLGTANGWLYESHDGGRTWDRLSQISHRNDLILDHILTDAKNPQRLIVGAFFVDRPNGGLYLSEDGGRTWADLQDMRGQSVRSLARSPSDPNEIVAGTLRGVFRSIDNGQHWTLISPEGSTEIHEIESLAVDPVNPQTIYAGTWHLPWKTTDGGAHWLNIKQGIIEDSDVFSILVDPAEPRIVYASACSGIYKSTDAAAQFKKVQGIPSAARRTRKLAQDPQHLKTVYAGTTEGLYRTLDAGQTWDRMTSPDIIINDVYIDPADSNHVLLATDRGGVLRSEDGATTFVPSNKGFSARQVTAYAADARHPAIVYAGVVNDKETGGVFRSPDGGISWRQQSAGLGGRDVFSLAMTPSRVLLAGTGHGIYRLQDDLWVDSGLTMQSSKPEHGAKISPGARRAPRPRPEVSPASAPPTPVATTINPTVGVDPAVYAMVADSFGIYAATSQGLQRGDPEGMVWSPVSALQMPDPRFVAMAKGVLLVAGLRNIAVGLNDGTKWSAVALPSGLKQISSVAVDDQKTLWVAGLEGVWYSADSGASWHQVRDLEIHQVDSVYFDAEGERMLLTTSESPVIFAVRLPDHKVTYWDTGWKLRFARPVGDHLLGITLYDGIVIQPKMVDSGGSELHAQGK